MKNKIRTRISKISVRLSFSYGILFFLTVFLLNIVILFFAQIYMNQTTSGQLENIRDTLLSEISNASDISGFDFVDLSHTNENIDIILIQNGSVVINTNPQYQPFAPSFQKVTKLESGENTIMYITDQIFLTDASVVDVQIIKNIDNDVDYFNAMSTMMLIIDAVIIVLSVLVGYWISRKALSPIDSMTKQAREISTSNLAKRIQISGPDDELTRLATTFNDLISRLSRAYIMQNEFALNASHELTTPLAVIQGYIELIDRWGKDTPDVMEEAITSIKAELKHMNGLLDTLYTLSKTDNELISLEKTEFLLNDLIIQLLKEYSLILTDTDFNFHAETKVLLFADTKLISQMIRAILDNSVKFNRNHAPIDITLQSTDQIVIIISDRGIGIPEEDLSHIFERFYRVDKSRTKAVGGTGLGLSLVKWIVEMHHGNIEVASVLGKGTSVTIYFPKKSTFQ